MASSGSDHDRICVPNMLIGQELSKGEDQVPYRSHSVPFMLQRQ